MEREMIDDSASRFKVHGGWIVSMVVGIANYTTVNSVFVPDANHEWVLPEVEENK
jgi:hypothetical protein